MSNKKEIKNSKSGEEAKTKKDESKDKNLHQENIEKEFINKILQAHEKAINSIVDSINALNDKKTLLKLDTQKKIKQLKD